VALYEQLYCARGAGSIVLPSIECALKMAEIYARVRFDDRKDTPVPPVLAPGG